MQTHSIHAPTKSWFETSAVVLFMAAMVAAPTSVAASNLLTAALLLLSLAALFPRPSQRLRCVAPLALSALVLVVASHALATAFSPVGGVRWGVWAEESWMKLLLVAVPVLLVGRPRDVGRAFDLLLVIASLVAIYGIVQRYTGIDLTRDRTTDPAAGRYMAEGFFKHHLSYGGNLLITATLALARALPGRGRWTRAARWASGATVLMFVAMVFTFARSAQIGLAAGAAALVLSYRGRLRRYGVAAVALVSLAILALPMIRERFLRILDGGEETRLNLWRSSWDGIRAHPWLGWGQGHFSEMMAAHEVPGFYNTRAHAHNEFLMHGVNAGLVGLAAQLFLVFAILTVLWRARDRAGDAAWIVHGMFAATVGLAASGLFQVFQTDDEVEFLYYLAVGGALAVVASCLARGDFLPTEDPPPPPSVSSP